MNFFRHSLLTALALILAAGVQPFSSRSAALAQSTSNKTEQTADNKSDQGTVKSVEKNAEKETEKMVFSHVYFFGYQGLDLKKIEADIPLKPGTEMAESKKGNDALLEGVNRVVEELVGKKTTDIATVFYQKSWTAYVGLPGASCQTVVHNPVPDGDDTLPNTMIQTYDENMVANMQSLKTGLPADQAKCEKLEELSKEQTKPIVPRVMQVLAEAKDHHQRTVAAHCLGLVATTQGQIDALADAANDENAGVRNNAVRALAVIASSKSEVAKLIPAERFVKLISSGTWVDRNKGSFVIASLVRNYHNAKLLARLKQDSLPALKEIARWDLGHASPALEILAAMADFPMSKTMALMRDGKQQEIIDAVPDH